jgi:hypothetical protein
MPPRVTMLELVAAVAENADTEAEIMATVVHMVNSGLVRLEGKPRGPRFDLRTMPAANAVAA